MTDPTPSTVTLSPLRRLAAGFVDPSTWAAVGYVLATTITTLALFIVAIALVVPSLVLCVVGVGFVLVPAIASLLHVLVGFERRRAGWVGYDVGLRTLGGGSIMARFRDPNRWRLIGFASTAWFVSLFAFVGLAVVWGAPLYLMSIPLWGWAIDSFSVAEIIGQAIAGAGLALLAPLATRGIGRLLGRFVELSVGPDQLAVMAQQVTDVTENRDEILTAVAGERRRIERNLHDGVQQQLVALGIDLGLAQSKIESDPEAARALLADATQKARESIGELRSIGRGLHPAILGDRGLDAALSAVVANSSVPLELRYDVAEEPPAAIAEAAYFIIAEATTNVMKHSKANLGVVDVQSSDGSLVLSIYDDGIGGADLSGTGLAGSAARVRGLRGTFELTSPAGGPTTLVTVLPYP